jgi:hypothetical protein
MKFRKGKKRIEGTFEVTNTRSYKDRIVKITPKIDYKGEEYDSLVEVKAKTDPKALTYRWYQNCEGNIIIERTIEGSLKGRDGKIRPTKKHRSYYISNVIEEVK